jgi:hypothetical protein
MQKVLLVGGSFALLAPRAAILAKTASHVTCCSPSEFVQMAIREDFALVVLCHSLSPEDLFFIASEARRRWPQSRVLHIWEENGQPSPVEHSVDAVVSPEPRKLAQTVAMMLAIRSAAQSDAAAAAAALSKTA